MDGSNDILTALESNAPNFSTLTALAPNGAPEVYFKNFSGTWDSDPSASIDVSGLKSFILNTSGMEVVNSGIVIGN